MFILGPRIRWPFDGNRDDVFESCVRHHLRDFGDGVEREAEGVAAFVHQRMPFYQRGVLWERGVVAFYHEVYVMDLKIASRFKISEVVSGFLGWGGGHTLGIGK